MQRQGVQATKKSDAKYQLSRSRQFMARVAAVPYKPESNMKNPYVVVSMDAIMPTSYGHIRHTLKAVYVALRSFSNFTYKPVTPGYQAIADRAGLKSVRSVANAVRELENAGLIQIQHVAGRKLCYHFTNFDHSKDSTQESNSFTQESNSTLHRNLIPFTQESNASLHRNLMPVNHRREKNIKPESFELESTNHSASLEDERFYSAAIHYFNLAASDYDSFNPNDRFTANTLAILRQKFPELQPFDLYHFPTWYKKYVRGKQGEQYRLPIKPEPLTTHLTKFLAGAARLDIKKLADAGLDVDCMSEDEIMIATSKIRYADLIGD